MEEFNSTAFPTISGDLMSDHFQFSDQDSLPKPDVEILTSNGLRIPAHTGILVRRPLFFSFLFYWLALSLMLIDSQIE
jgi:hypothetical protein